MAYFESKGGDISQLLEITSTPEEFLEDPSYWLQADTMEKFLGAIVTNFSEEAQILRVIAQSTPELRSWGVFDSVLRMMPLTEVFAQPNRFISYFISPVTEVTAIERKAQGISFEVPVSLDEFPLTKSFLAYAFESLPLFRGEEAGVCRWTGHRLEILWDKNLSSSPSPDVSTPALSQELLRSIVSQLEQHQIELQQKNAELEARNQQLREAFQKLQFNVQLQSPLQNASQGNTSGRTVQLDHTEALTMKKHLAKLADYMVRAQQLVTILTGVKPQQPIVKEALRRTDWTWVKENYPLTVASCFEILQKPETPVSIVDRNH